MNGIVSKTEHIQADESSEGLGSNGCQLVLVQVETLQAGEVAESTRYYAADLVVGQGQVFQAGDKVLGGIKVIRLLCKSRYFRLVRG